jgi:hypothetical protein
MPALIRCTVPAPQHKVRAVQQTPTPSLREPRTAVSKAEPTFLCPGPLEPGLGPLDNHRSLKVREHRQPAETEPGQLAYSYRALSVLEGNRQLSLRETMSEILSRSDGESGDKCPSLLNAVQAGAAIATTKATEIAIFQGFIATFSLFDFSI